jgi:hypothetical protein
LKFCARNASKSVVSAWKPSRIRIDSFRATIIGVGWDNESILKDSSCKRAGSPIRRLIALVRELAPTVLCFFVAFLMIFVMFRLFAQKYSIEFSALSKAAIGALILGKVIPLLERSGSRYSFGAHRRCRASAFNCWVTLRVTQKVPPRQPFERGEIYCRGKILPGTISLSFK